ncbi:MAG: hypothetical protein ACOY3Y_09050, partial [Acidobacteriota bacterium]
MGLGRIAAWAVALLWACSPFALEPAVSVAIRFESLLLLAWLGLFLAWPGPGGVWTRSRLIAVAALVTAAAASKETWVVTPGLVWALERWWRQATVRSAARVAALAACASAAYALAYFAAFPGGKGYYRLEPDVLAKIPHQLAAFLHLETLLPLGFPWTWTGALATAIVAAAGIVLAAGWFTVRADLGDLARVSCAHAELIREARHSARDSRRTNPPSTWPITA